MSLLKWLGLVGDSPGTAGRALPAETETVRRIVRELEGLEPDRARFVAAFGYTLSRVAGADLRVSEEETLEMERIVSELVDLSPEQAILVVQIAKQEFELFGGTENYLVTRELSRLASREQKLAVLEALFAVSGSDRTITTAENNVIRQIAAELKLDHADYVAIRLRFAERLAVLRDPAEERDTSRGAD